MVDASLHLILYLFLFSLQYGFILLDFCMQQQLISSALCLHCLSFSFVYLLLFPFFSLRNVVILPGTEILSFFFEHNTYILPCYLNKNFSDTDCFHIRALCASLMLKTWCCYHCHVLFCVSLWVLAISPCMVFLLAPRLHFLFGFIGDVAKLTPFRDSVLDLRLMSSLITFLIFSGFILIDFMIFFIFLSFLFFPSLASSPTEQSLALKSAD